LFCIYRKKRLAHSDKNVDWRKKFRSLQGQVPELRFFVNVAPRNL